MIFNLSLVIKKVRLIEMLKLQCSLMNRKLVLRPLVTTLKAFESNQIKRKS